MYKKMANQMLIISWIEDKTSKHNIKTKKKET